MQPTPFGSHVPQHRRHPACPFHPQMYTPSVAALPVVASQYSSLRSSAQARPRTTTASPYYMTNFGRQAPSSERFQDDHASFPSNPDTIYQDMTPQEQSQDYLETQYTYTTPIAHPYRPQIPRSLTWSQEKHQLYHEYSATPHFSPQHGEGRYVEPVGYGGYFEDSPKEAPYVPTELSPFYGSQPTIPSEPALTAFTTQENVLRSVVYSTAGSPRLPAETMAHAQSGSSPPHYALHSPALQYPLTPENDIPPRFVRMQDISPSPTISPDQVYSNLPPPSPVQDYPTSQMTYVPSEASSTSADNDESLLEMLSGATSARRSSATDRSPRKRQRISSDSDSVSGVSADSGESEREEDGGDMEDEEYTPEEDTPRAAKTRRVSLRRSKKSVGAVQPSKDEDRPRMLAPVPVPNLTKKSRGRRVPTSAVVVSPNGVDKNVRSYRCKVPGCNKFFQRGEHLKRHVRSIHTNEKPHRCPFRKCGKDFSRHDNLRQHMRVHRNEPLESEDTST